MLTKILKVKVLKIHSQNRDKFTGHCHFKNDARTFYYKRIIEFEVVRVQTGEIMTPMEWRYAIQGTKVAEKAMLEEQARLKK